MVQRNATYSPLEQMTKWREPTRFHGYVPVNLSETLSTAHHSSYPSFLGSPSAEKIHHKTQTVAIYGRNKWHNSIVEESPINDG